MSDADVDQPGDDVIVRRDVTDRDDDDDGDDVAVCGRCCWPVRDVTAGRRLDTASDRRADDGDDPRLAAGSAAGGSG